MPLIIASGSWADWAMVGITAVAVIGGLVTLFFAFRQLRLQTDELKRQADQQEEAIKIRTAQRALDLMRMLADLGRVPVQIPAIAPFFQRGAELPTGDDQLRDQVLAHASGYVSLAEAIGWQRNVDQLEDDALAEWQKYFTKLYETTPALREVVNDQKTMLLPETRSLFGLPEPANS